MAIRLGVNIDHVATLRRLRDTPYPDLIRAAELCVEGGADQITVHLREDRRHIVDDDVRGLKEALKVDLNFEMAATTEMLEIALAIKPHSICIVPEKREERTTEGGLNLKDSDRNRFLSDITAKAKDRGILVSYFIEPSHEDILRSVELGSDAIELHTGSLCTAIQLQDSTKAKAEWARLCSAVALAATTNLRIHAGHGIDYTIARELALMPEISEYNIGHSIVCEAVYCGIKNAVRKMKDALQKTSP